MRLFNRGDWRSLAVLVSLVSLAFISLVFSIPLVDFDTINPADNLVTINDSVYLNFSITATDLENVTYNWDGVNYTLYNDSLILMYNFDNMSALGENESNFTDVSLRSNNGTCTSCPTVNTTNCVYGNCLTFNAVNSYINISNKDDFNFAGNDEVTFSLWLKTPSGNDDDMSILADFTSAYKGYELVRIKSADILRWQWAGTTGSYYIDSTNDINDGNWHHVVVVKGPGQGVAYLDMYIDGKKEVVSAQADNLPAGSEANDNHLIIGYRRGNQYPWEGEMDQFIVWNRSLTTAEINQTYMSYLYKYDTDKWALYVNQSKSPNVALDAGTYTYFIAAGNDTLINMTDVRSITVDEIPAFNLVSYTPNDTTSLDPNTSITVRVNVTDGGNNLDTVLLQWKNQTGATWDHNVTMNNETVNGISTWYNVTWFNFTYADNFTFRIWANDTDGNSAFSSSTDFQGLWDCTWTYMNQEIGAESGWDENKAIGNLTINNTGDVEHSNNNCSIKFRLTYDLAEGRIYFDDIFVKPSSDYTIDPGENQTISVNGSFLTDIREDDFVITLQDYLGTSNMTTQKNFSGSLVTTTGGPYIYQSFVSPPSSLSLTVANYSLSSYVRNLIGDTYTAYNVSFNWTLPINFIIQNVGNGTSNYTNISNTSLNYNNIIVEFNATNLPNLKPLTYNLTITALGYNSTGSLISDADGETLLTSRTEVTLVCNDVSDGVCPLYCGNTADPDCTAAALSLSPGGGAGGATGGSGGGGSGLSVAEKEKLFQTEDTYELIRGENNMFVLVAENPFIHPITDVTLEISGFFKKYLSINPRTIARIPEKGEGMFNITIKSPKYFTKGDYELNFTMTGFINKSTQAYDKSVPFTGSIFVVLSIHELSEEEAERLLKESKTMVSELKKANLIIGRLELLIEQAEYLLEQKDYEGVKAIYEEILENKEAAFGTLEIINEIEEDLNNALRRGLKMPDTQRLMVLVKAAMERGDFITAFERADDAKITFALESVGRFNLMAYVRNNFIQIVVGSLIAFGIGYFAWLIIKWRFSIKRLKMLRKEENILLGLIEQIQKECFELGKMSMREYGISLVEYEKKMSKVIHKVIRYETLKINVFKLFKGETFRLEEEKERLLKLVAETQDSYVNSNKMDTRVYEYRMKSYAERLVEVEERLASIEAKKSFKEIKK